MKNNQYFFNDEPTAIIVVGLPGSGKSTLIEYITQNPWKDYKVYDSWGTYWFNDKPKDQFTSETRYPELVEDLRQKRNVIISSYTFSDPYKLKECVDAINIPVNILYFENNPTSCINNVKVRDAERGGVFMENGNYVGTILDGIPDFVHKINNINKLSPKYVIPKDASIIKVKHVNKEVSKLYDLWVS